MEKDRVRTVRKGEKSRVTRDADTVTWSRKLDHVLNLRTMTAEKLNNLIKKKQRQE